jgi:hypothetical protein
VAKVMMVLRFFDVRDFFTGGIFPSPKCPAL